MSRFFATILFLFLSPLKVTAAVSAGTGFSTLTSGRTIPALTAGIHTATWSFTGVTTGVRTPLYYHSGWTTHALRMWDAGTLGWGELRAGFGGGLFFARRGYRDTRSTPMNTTDDFNFGPAFRVSWAFYSPGFLAIEGLFGLKKPLPLLGLAAQDMAHVTVGVEF